MFHLISAGIFTAIGIYDFKIKSYGWATVCGAIVAMDLYTYFN